MIDSHRQPDIIEALIKQPFEVREQVEEVSIDMWGGFPSRCRTSIPKCQNSYQPFSRDESS